MAEEFQESDVVFSDYGRDEDSNSYFICQEQGRNSGTGRHCKKGASNNSVPVDINIPDKYIFRYVDSDIGFEEGYRDGGEMIPPHVIVGRRRLFAGKMAFSVCTGNGIRTLKGRNLSRVRNSILRMTGFLET